VKKKRISWRAFVACIDPQTPHKLSGQSATHVAWTSKFPTVVPSASASCGCHWPNHVPESARCFHPCRECAHWRSPPGAYSDRDTPAPVSGHPKPVWHKPPRASSMLPYMNNLLGVFDEVIIALFIYKLNYVVDSSHKPLAAMMAPSICGRRTKRARVVMPTTIPARWRATVAARKPSAYASASIAPDISNPWA
jgi:hypothetical protein